jgi:hypothetical protein
MKKNIILMLLLLFITPIIFAGNLDTLIRQNINNSSMSDNQSVEQKNSSLWIQVCSHQHLIYMQLTSELLKKIELNGQAIDIPPIESVKNCPKVSDLRYFFKDDKNNADKLLESLKKIFPQVRIQLKDFTGKYSWLKPGHYELWIGTNVKSNLVIP